MPLTATFVADPKAFCGAHSVMIQEPDPTAFRRAQMIRQNNVVNPIVAHFNVDVTNLRGTKLLRIYYNNQPATAVQCYFLPYLPDGATTMTLGGPPDFFFTSQLTGCSVQVIGPANAPTVTHGNAATVFNRAVGGGAAHAQTAIDVMLPAPIPQVASGKVTRADYHAKNTGLNVWAGKGSLAEGAYEHGVKVHRDVAPSGGYEVGCIVFGVRKGGGNWKFYYQSSVGVHGSVEDGYLWKSAGRSNFYNASIVLGNPVKFFG
jgi:hypothetical protein